MMGIRYNHRDTYVDDNVKLDRPRGVEARERVLLRYAQAISVRIVEIF